jgi:hypothetical protein
MGANELGIKRGFTILKEHLNDLGHIRQKFIDSGSLGMGTLPSRDVPHE